MPPVPGTHACFAVTNWMLVVAAKLGDTLAELAMNELCGKYWYPVYAFIRHKRWSPHDAEDLTQGFFADLLGRDWLANVNPEKGKFRTFLQACLTNYLKNYIKKITGPTQSPGQPVIPLDALGAEERYVLEPRDETDPAVLFDRRWAMTLVRLVLDNLKAQYVARGKAELFEVLHPFLMGQADRGGFCPAAARLNMNEGAVRKAATDLRKRFRELLNEEIAETVKDPAQVEEERAYLLGLFGRK